MSSYVSCYSHPAWPLDTDFRLRDALPSINHFDMDKPKKLGMDHQRYQVMPGIGVSTAPLASPVTTTYPGPPPPYSYALSTPSSVPGVSGHVSPSSSSRLTTVDGKEPPKFRQSLPSIHEALGSGKSVACPEATLPSQIPDSSHSIMAPPAPSGNRTYPEGPLGPSNPFSLPSASNTSLKAHTYTPQFNTTSAPAPDPKPASPVFSAINANESKSQPTQSFNDPRSPRLGPGPPLHFLSSLQKNICNGYGLHSADPVTAFPSYKSTSDFSARSTDPPSSMFPSGREPGYSEKSSKYEDVKRPLPRSAPNPGYGESVKRHLESFDVQMALNDITEASARSHEFSRIWSQHVHEVQRNGYLAESLPELHDVEDMMRQSNRVMEAFAKIRDIVIAQQNVLAEQRARAVKGEQFGDDFDSFHEDYNGGGGFAGNDAKKRRGVTILRRLGDFLLLTVA